MGNGVLYSGGSRPVQSSNFLEENNVLHLCCILTELNLVLDGYSLRLAMRRNRVGLSVILVMLSPRTKRD